MEIHFGSTNRVLDSSFFTVIVTDTIAEKWQVGKTTFVSLGQDSTIYLVDDLPMINLNFGHYQFMMTGPCQVVGLEDGNEEKQRGVKVFPNPTAGIIQIETASEIKAIQVIDISGRIVLTQEGKVSTINLEEQARGLYLLRIQFQNGEFSNEKVLLE